MAYLLYKMIHPWESFFAELCTYVQSGKPEAFSNMVGAIPGNPGSKNADIPNQCAVFRNNGEGLHAPAESVAWLFLEEVGLELCATWSLHI